MNNNINGSAALQQCLFYPFQLIPFKQISNIIRIYDNYHNLLAYLYVKIILTTLTHRFVEQVMIM